MAFEPGYQQQEALDLITLCAMVNDTPTTQETGYESTGPNPPADWELVYAPPVAIPPFDSYFEIWQDTSTNVPANTARIVIIFRGTTPETMSMAEDAIFPMVNAENLGFSYDGIDLNFKFAGNSTPNITSDTNTGSTFNQTPCIHAGFALGMLSILNANILPGGTDENILNLLTDLFSKPGFFNKYGQFYGMDAEIYITGHSQGAALATLFRSYVEYQPLDLKGSPVSYKTYVFAQPKPGNSYYANDFDLIASNYGMAIRVTNSKDWVPQAPLAIQQINDLNELNPITYVEDAYSPTLKKVLNTMDHYEKEAANWLTEWIKNEIYLYETGNDLPDVKLDFNIVPTLNYAGCGAPFTLVGQYVDPGTNYDNFMGQHHATNYLALIEALDS